MISMKYLGPPQSGSLAAETFSRNQFGQYVRARTSPVQPSSGYAADARTRFSDAVAAWPNVSLAQAEAWEDYARSCPSTDALGQGQIWDGRAAFLSVNVVWVTHGSVPGPVLDPPPLPRWFIRTLTAEWTAGVLLLDWTPAPSVNDFAWYSTPVVSTGAIRPTSGGRRYFIENVSTAVVTPPYVATVNWAFRFGAVPLPGEVTFFGWREYSNGRLSPEQVLRLVAT